MIDLLEDRLSVELLEESGFTLYELYDLQIKLSKLEDIKIEMIDNCVESDFNDGITIHHTHIDIILDSLMGVTQLIYEKEGNLFVNLGNFGKFCLN